MAKLVSFVICDSINNLPIPEAGVVANLVSPQIALRPQFIPGSYSFGMAVGVADVNLQESNKMHFTISDPEGVVIQNSGESELPVFAAHDTMPQEYQGFMINIDVRNLVIQSEGEYKFSFFINGECIGTHGIPIFKKVV